MVQRIKARKEGAAVSSNIERMLHGWATGSCCSGMICGFFLSHESCLPLARLYCLQCAYTTQELLSLAHRPGW